MFSATTVNKRSRRLWRAAPTTGRNFVNTTDRWENFFGGYIDGREDVYVLDSSGTMVYVRLIGEYVCIMRSSSTSSWLVRESAKKLFLGENSDFDRSTTPSPSHSLSLSVSLAGWRDPFRAISPARLPLAGRISSLIGLPRSRVCHSTCEGKPVPRVSANM